MGMEFDIEKDSIWKRNSIPESNLISKRNQPQIIKKWMAPMGFGNRQIPKKLNHFLKDPIFSTHEKLVSIDFPMFGNIFSCPLKINGNWNMCVCFIVLGENKLKYISIAYYMKYTDLYWENDLLQNTFLISFLEKQQVFWIFFSELLTQTVDFSHPKGNF